MQGKHVIITGGTSGIGQAAAEVLAGMGARIVLIARNRERAEATLGRLRAIAPEANHTAYFADLSRAQETRRVAEEIAGNESRIDVLINNAGAIFGRREETEEGLERTFATNHMSYFVLTQGLLPRLAASTPARIINTSSRAHQGAKLDFADLQSARGYRAFPAYGRSKLCNILFTRELARQLSGSGVTANCLHPGFVRTRFGDNSAGWSSRMLRLAKMFAISIQEGAETLVYLASSPDVANVSGAYFYKSRAIQPSREAQDDLAATRLWSETTRLIH